MATCTTQRINDQCVMPGGRTPATGIDDREHSNVDSSGAPRPEAAMATITDGDEEGATDEHCVVCLESLSEPCVAQPCGHRYFDFLCLLSWLFQARTSCPLCNATVTTVQYGAGLDQTLVVQQHAQGKASDEPTTLTTTTTTTTTTATTTEQTSEPHARRCLPRASERVTPRHDLDRRRHVYHAGLYALHLGANNRSQCYCTLTPALVARDPDLVVRARTFLRRELQVFWPAHTVAPASTEFLIEYVVRILQTIDLQESTGRAEQLLAGFFGKRTKLGTSGNGSDNDDHHMALATARHVLHELRSFLRSPYRTLAAWDANVQYELSLLPRPDPDTPQGLHKPQDRRRIRRRGNAAQAWIVRGGGPACPAVHRPRPRPPPSRMG